MEFRNGDIGIQPIKEEDKYVVTKWLSDPKVLQYYEGRDCPFTLQMVEEKFLKPSDGVIRCIITYKGKGIGYLQYYPIDEEERNKYGYGPSDEVIYGTDQFIGEPDYWNQGLGTSIINSVKGYLIDTAGVDRLVMDPMIWNERAIKCYEKCGYKKIKRLPKNEKHEGVWHDAWLVEYRPEQRKSQPGLLEERIEEGVNLRKKGDIQASIDLFKKMIEEDPLNGHLHYQSAWSHDALGKESEAIPYYKKALELGLNESDLQGAYVGLGSTFRTLGQYENAKKILNEGMERFPENNALKLFYSMTLHNVKEHSEAMEILLNLLAETSSDHTIQSYHKAIKFYAGQLDMIWD
ncbi:tetratricopeptide repeat protein [Rossellomorea sp. NS-SX7]|uniref:tetratricopeptide repeat protein n=1 Tax=Rossellomorea sp. NS-SX7 TaxID=3463856 RepID=UPI0040599929